MAVLARNLEVDAGLGADLLAPLAIWNAFLLNDAEGILRLGDSDYDVEAVNHDKPSKYHNYIRT